MQFLVQSVRWDREKAFSSWSLAWLLLPPSPACLTPLHLPALLPFIHAREPPTAVLLLGNPPSDDSQLPKGYDFIAFTTFQQDLITSA